MAIPFATDEWVSALKEELNRSKAYREAAKTWEGDFWFVVDRGPGVPEPLTMYMDLWHGECREAYTVKGKTAPPAFVVEAPLATWRRVIDKKLDPVQAIVTRQLKLKGNMIKVLKAPKAAVELVQSAARVPTKWP